MFDVDDSVGGYRNPLPCHLNPKTPTLLDTVGHPAELGNELLFWIAFLDVAL
jgi:hypothetical protein